MVKQILCNITPTGYVQDMVVLENEKGNVSTICLLFILCNNLNLFYVTLFKCIFVLYYSLVVYFNHLDPKPCEGYICPNGGTCIPTADGFFTCKCPVGYTGPRCERKLMFSKE